MNETVSDNLTINQSLKKKIRTRPLVYNIVKWIWASVARHFEVLRGNIPFYVEGQDHDLKDQNAELRINGPFLNHTNQGYWKIDADINILITSAIDDEDFYKIYKIIDQFLDGFTDIITVYKYGDNPQEDTGEQLGCLIMRTDIQDSIVISNFGRIEPSLRIQQSTINAIYQLELSV